MPVSCTCCHFQKGSDLVCMGYSSAGCAHKCARKSLSQVGTIALQWFKCHCPSPRTLEALASECVWPGVFHCTFSSDNDSECVGGSSNASTGWGEAGRRELPGVCSSEGSLSRECLCLGRQWGRREVTHTPPS
jgi:hypothetical protein